MTMLSYPEFVEGQTLTREELNELRDHLVDRDRTLGRTVGFGIAGGLVGKVQGGTLKIAPGLAIDQTGEALMLPAEVQIPVPPVPDADTFAFVTGTDGFTVVLVHTDVAEPRTPCTETGCQGHALLHTTGVDLRIVRGRLTSTHPDFEEREKELLAVTPLTLTPNGAVTGAFVKLRDAITKRIGTRLRPDLLAKLSAMTLDTADLPAVKAYKAGFLNQLLFATLDLLLFEALVSQEVVRDTPTPGVALGWLHQTGGVWVWDCGYRHQWEPPIGLTQALLGGSCADPALPWLQRLESLIDTFTLPPMPKPDDDPVTLEPGQIFICKNWKYHQHQDCNVILYPHKELLETWRERWTKRPPDFTLPPRGYKFTLADEVYGDFTPDGVDVGIIDLGPTFGRNATVVLTALQTLIGNAGLTPSVQIKTLDEARNMPGFSHSGVVGAADTVVLIQDAQKKIVGTGRVAIGHSQRELGTALPATQQKAAQAIEIAKGVQQDFGAIDGTVTQHGQSLEGLLKFQNASVQWQTQAGQQIAAVPNQIEVHTQRAMATFQQTFSLQLNEFMSQTVNTLTDKVAFTAEHLENVAGKVDVLVGNKRLNERETAVNTGLLDVLRTVRRSVEEVAPDDRRDAVRATLATVDDGLVRLAAVGQAGGSVLADSPQTLTAVVDSLVEALRAVGTPAATMRTLGTRTRALRRAIEQ